MKSFGEVTRKSYTVNVPRKLCRDVMFIHEAVHGSNNASPTLSFWGSRTQPTQVPLRT